MCVCVCVRVRGVGSGGAPVTRVTGNKLGRTYIPPPSPPSPPSPTGSPDWLAHSEINAWERRDQRSPRLSWLHTRAKPA